MMNPLRSADAASATGDRVRVAIFVVVIGVVVALIVGPRLFLK